MFGYRYALLYYCDRYMEYKWHGYKMLLILNTVTKSKAQINWPRAIDAVRFYRSHCCQTSQLSRRERQSGQVPHKQDIRRTYKLHHPSKSWPKEKQHWEWQKWEWKSLDRGRPFFFFLLLAGEVQANNFLIVVFHVSIHAFSHVDCCLLSAIVLLSCLRWW